jgi:DNA-binding NarL/FixJ family response regulator
MTSQHKNGANVRLVLVDDNPTFRSCLARWLGERPDYTMVGMAETGGQALALPAALAPDVVLLDVHLQDRFGINLIAPLKALWPHTRVIMLTFEDSPQYYKVAQAEGAAGFVVKTNAERDLMPAIDTAMAASDLVRA